MQNTNTTHVSDIRIAIDTCYLLDANGKQFSADGQVRIVGLLLHYAKRPNENVFESCAIIRYPLLASLSILLYPDFLLIRHLILTNTIYKPSTSEVYCVIHEQQACQTVTPFVTWYVYSEYSLCKEITYDRNGNFIFSKTMKQSICVNISIFLQRGIRSIYC